MPPRGERRPNTVIGQGHKSKVRFHPRLPCPDFQPTVEVGEIKMMLAFLAEIRTYGLVWGWNLTYCIVRRLSITCPKKSNCIRHTFHQGHLVKCATKSQRWVFIFASHPFPTATRRCKISRINDGISSNFQSAPTYMFWHKTGPFLIINANRRKSPHRSKQGYIQNYSMIRLLMIIGINYYFCILGWPPFRLN
jgi:hypothetical protein